MQANYIAIDTSSGALWFLNSRQEVTGFMQGKPDHFKVYEATDVTAEYSGERPRGQRDGN